MPLIRSISGLRATVEDSLTNQVVENNIYAFNKICPEGEIIIGRDGRPSGKKIEDQIVKIFNSMNRESVILGVVPTPTIQYTVENRKAAGGIAITASHNPAEWNGLKFINNKGVFLDADENKTMWEIADGNFKINYNNSENCKSINIEDAIEKHIQSILSLKIFQESNVINKIKERNFRVVVDAVNSSGSVAILSLLAQFNCSYVPLYCDGTGKFPHTPEPLPENLSDLANSIVKNEANLGIAVDPDADRLVIIDDKGKPIGEEKTIVLAAESILNSNFVNSSGYEKSAVVNHSTTMLVDYVASKHSAKVYRSAVGEINVVKKMIETNSIIGGEGSGGVILPASHYGRDSLVGTALILKLLAQRSCSISELTNSLPDYKMIKTKMSFNGNFPKLIEYLIKEFPGFEINLEDGFKAISQNCWIQVRSSNTEPIIRIIAESESEEEASNLINQVNFLISKNFS